MQVMETFAKEPASDLHADKISPTQPTVSKLDLITHVAVGKMNIHDSKALLPALEDTAARGVAPEFLIADTHYGSIECLTQAKDRGVELVAPAKPPKGKGQGKLTLEDFELD